MAASEVRRGHGHSGRDHWRNLGAGTYSLDAKLFGRARWPGFITVGLFLVAIAAGVATWVLLNGTNPIHLRNPAG
jgi:putative oxidoreductase